LYHTFGFGSGGSFNKFVLYSGMGKKIDVEVHMVSLPVYQQMVCLSGRCRAVSSLNKPVSMVVCQLAELQVQLGRSPMVAEARAKQIDTSAIPTECPNGYTSEGALKFRQG
jgi:hypothetical protein